MGVYSGSRRMAVAASAGLLCAFALAACGGGSASDSPVNNQLKLSSSVQSAHVAKYAAAFGVLAGPGVATVFTSIGDSFVAAALTGTAASTVACAAGGTANVLAQNATTAGLRAGESGTVTFAACKGQVNVPAISGDASVDGVVSVQIQAVTGTIGDDTADWSYTATETLTNLKATTTGGTTTMNGALTYTVAHSVATGLTITTASAPTVAIDRTQSSSNGSITGTISIAGLSFVRTASANPASETLAAVANVTIRASDVVMAFDVTTPTPVTLANGDISAGTVELTTVDATETVTAINATTFALTAKSGSATGSYTVDASEFDSIVGG